MQPRHLTYYPLEYGTPTPHPRTTPTGSKSPTSWRVRVGFLGMPFGISLGELLATAGVFAVAFGPGDIPALARRFGKLTGHATGRTLR